jgi:hypothetical protein
MAPELLRRIAHNHKEVSLETEQVLRQAASEIETLTAELQNLRAAFNKLKAEQDEYDSTKPSDLRATQKVLGRLHDQFSILPGPTTGTLGGDIRGLAEQLLSYCQNNQLMSTCVIKMKLQDITRALP